MKCPITEMIDTATGANTMHEKPSNRELKQRLQDLEHRCRYFKSILGSTTDLVRTHDPELDFGSEE